MEFHAMLVHFPIALLLASVVLDILGALRRDEKLHYAGYYTLIGGVAGAVLAVASGMFEADRMAERFARMQQAMAESGGAFAGGEAMRAQMMQTVSVHRLLAFAVLAVFLVALFWRVSRRGLLEGRALNSYLAVVLIGAVILGSTGFYGGKLAHRRPEGRDRAGAGFRMNGNGGDMQLERQGGEFQGSGGGDFRRFEP